MSADGRGMCTQRLEYCAAGRQDLNGRSIRSFVTQSDVLTPLFARSVVSDNGFSFLLLFLFVFFFSFFLLF